MVKTNRVILVAKLTKLTVNSGDMHNCTCYRFPHFNLQGLWQNWEFLAFSFLSVLVCKGPGFTYIELTINENEAYTDLMDPRTVNC